MAKAEAYLALSRLDDPDRQAARARARVSDPQATARRAAHAAVEKKAGDVVLIDLRKQSSYTDFLVVCSGTNERQLEAIADAVDKSLREAGEKPIGTEGARGGRWVLLDFGDVVIHVFQEDERAYYDLEGLWSDAPTEHVGASGP
jgi:ribosome-associated protein